MKKQMSTVAEFESFIDHPSFLDPDAEAVILAPMPGLTEYEDRRSRMHIPSDVPPELAALYEYPLLNREQEAHLFRAMNYRKFQAWHLRHRDMPLTAAERRRLELARREGQQIRNWLVQANLRLVVPFARLFAGQGHGFLELLSEGNLSLMKAVDKFDFSRGFKFSTYGSWAIKRNFARSLQKEQQQHDRFQSNYDDLDQHESEETDRSVTTEDARKRVNHMLATLTPREQQILRQRAGLDNGAEPATLEAIGKGLGISKERVRQLAQRAIDNLRKHFATQ
jgi:RNA polymerase primary sigma factor